MRFKVIRLKYFSLLCMIFFSICCNSQNCLDLDENFKSYEEAKYVIKSTDFNFSDSCDTSKSSWVRGAEYYSCDGDYGYLLIQLKERVYIHKDLPRELWDDFKRASSFGRFYNYNIKGKYRLRI